MDTKQAVEHLVEILNEIETLKGDLKSYVEEVKDANLPHKAIMKAAALIQKQKDKDFVEETDEIRGILDSLV